MNKETRKRIFWLCNHVALLECECGLLKKLGFEVYVPKITAELIEEEANNRSTNIIYDYDADLTIPKEDLDKLNGFNFYNNMPTEEITKILNKYFGTLIMIVAPPAYFYLPQIFKGQIILRAFGKEGNSTYEKALQKFQDLKMINPVDEIKYRLSKIFKFLRPKEITHLNKSTFVFHSVRDRVKLGASYDNIKDNELPFFKNRALFLPLGLPDSVWKQENSWVGSTKKIMFVCPNICEVPYYGNIWKEFTMDFSDLPHSIFGKQGKKHFNKNVMGFLERSAYDEYLKKYKVMFYHSREERHLHYHPLEAIVFGMPLIYMSSGLLERFGGADQPGMAHTFEEAREKLERVLEGDVEFINEIKKKQVKILDEFRYDYVKSVWEKNFLPLVKN